MPKKYQLLKETLHPNGNIKAGTIFKKHYTKDVYIGKTQDNDEVEYHENIIEWNSEWFEELDED